MKDIDLLRQWMKKNGLVATADTFSGLLSQLTTQVYKRGEEETWTQDGEGWQERYRHYTDQGEEWKKEL
jgi:hypothetical protein